MRIPVIICDCKKCSSFCSDFKQVKPGFTNYQPQPKYSWALSEIEGKGDLVKTKDHLCFKFLGLAYRKIELDAKCLVNV